jgi:hypothetical protein
MEDRTQEVAELKRLWAMWLDERSMPDERKLLRWATTYSIKALTQAIQRTSRKQANVGGTMPAHELHRYAASVAMNKAGEQAGTIPRNTKPYGGVPAEWLGQAQG